MKKVKVIVLSAVAALLVNCGTTSTVPITGRKQNLMVSDEKVLSLSNEQYSEYMKTAKPSTNAANTAMVKRVGQRLAAAVERYLNSNGLSQEVKNYSWEFNLVQDQQVNAFCMPGGKIVVYEGLLPVTKDETSLAIVLGHEVAHAVAKHSAEQMSTAIRQQYGAQALGMVLSGAGVSDGMTNLAGTVFGLGAKGASAKYSRDHESEADHLGIIFAAMAGYDPQAAVPFWQPGRCGPWPLARCPALPAQTLRSARLATQEDPSRAAQPNPQGQPRHATCARPPHRGGRRGILRGGGEADQRLHHLLLQLRPGCGGASGQLAACSRDHGRGIHAVQGGVTWQRARQRFPSSRSWAGRAAERRPFWRRSFRCSARKDSAWA